MKKGTILYIGGFQLPDGNAAAHRVKNIGSILINLGYKLHYLGVYKGSLAHSSTVMKDVEISNVKYPVNIYEWFKYLTDFSVIKDKIELHNDLKFVICYNLPSIVLFKTIKYCKKNGIKVIGDTTEWYSDKRLIKYLDTNYRMKYLNKRLDGNILISTFLKNYYEGFSPTILVPPLIDSNESKWDLEENEKEKEIIKLVYSGSPGEHKDKLNLIVEAISNVKFNNKIEFNIVGITKEQYLNDYPTHRDLLVSIRQAINFKGRVSHSESIRYVKDAHFQIFIREYSRMNNAGFPTKFVESMACGTPVITTKTSDLKDYLNEGVNGYFVEYNNHGELAVLLNKLTQMSITEIYRIKENCFLMNDFDYKNYIEKFSSFFDEIDVKTSKKG